MTIAEALTSGHQRLGAVSDSPRLDAEVLLSHILKTDRTTLLRESQDHLTPQQLEHYQAWVGARAGGYPVAYLTGYQQFYGLQLHVTPDVLIPRPASELLVDSIRRRYEPDEPLKLADIGTGSGALALALSIHFPHAQVFATDISPQALSIAHYNARHNRLTERMTFAHGSLLEPFSKLPTPDVIVANLPYLAPGQMAEPGLQHEPRLALAGGKDGLLMVWQLLDQLPTVAPWRGVILELDPQQIDTIASFLTAHWPQYELEYLTDGNDRRGVALWETA